MSSDITAEQISKERLAKINSTGAFTYYGWPQKLVVEEAMKMARELQRLRYGIPHLPAPSMDEATHRHLKRGSEYALIGYGKMQAENWHDPSWANFTDDHGPTVDMREVAIYRDVSDNSLWVRPKEEFEDGRFIPLVPGASDDQA